MKQAFRYLAILPLTMLASCTQQEEEAAVEMPQAANLSCNFTEPFFTLEYEGASGTVFYSGVDSDYDEATKTFKKSVFAEKARIVFADKQEASKPKLGSKLRLIDGDDKTILDLTVDFDGSNGMSDHLYPVTALQQGKYGPHETGCETPEWPVYQEKPMVSDEDAAKLIHSLTGR